MTKIDNVLDGIHTIDQDYYNALLDECITASADDQEKQIYKNKLLRAGAFRRCHAVFGGG